VADPGFLKVGGGLHGGGQTVAYRPHTTIGHAGGYRPPVCKGEAAAPSAPSALPLNPPLVVLQVNTAERKNFAYIQSAI